jgi:N-alpha-acetyltransferase 15/16, NatA auxiliary subunit
MSRQCSYVDELVRDMFVQCEKPLEEAMRFLQPLEDFAGNFLETHYLGFEVHYRRRKYFIRSLVIVVNMNLIDTYHLGKILLMVRCLKRMAKLDSDHGKFHSCLMKFFKLGNRTKTLFFVRHEY